MNIFLFVIKLRIKNEIVHILKSCAADVVNFIHLATKDYLVCTRKQMPILIKRVMYLR